MADRKAHGLEATNQEYVRYDQVRKPQQYHLNAVRTGSRDRDIRLDTVSFSY